MEFVPINPQDQELLKEGSASGDGPDVYTSSNPIVRELFARRLKCLMKMAAPPSPNRVLDFGGGNGILLPTISRHYKEVFCIDLMTWMAEELILQKGFNNITCLKGELPSFSLPSNYFDTIIATDVLEHLPVLDEIIKEFQRILVPTGELLVSSPSENLFYDLGRKVFGYTKPLDHFHASDFIDKTISNFIPLSKRRYFPINLSAFAVFSLARFEKK